MVGTLGVCAICGTFVAVGRATRPDIELQAAVSKAMTDAIAASMPGSIAAADGSSPQILIDEDDFSVNNMVGEGEAGISSGTDGPLIAGLETRFSGQGITLYMNGEEVYAGIATVVDGKIDLIHVVVSNAELKRLLTASGFEQAMEDGINRALSDAELVPLVLITGYGILAISTVPASQAPTWVVSS